MRVSSSTDLPSASAYRSGGAAPSGTGSSFAGILAGETASASSSDGARPDFTNMTRKDLASWMNGQITSGRMSLDDSSAFLGFTLAMPVDGSAAGMGGNQAVDFTRLAQDGMSWARGNGDETGYARLAKALATMRGTGEIDRTL